MTLLYWCNDGEDRFEDVPNQDAAYAAAGNIVHRYKRSVWFFDTSPDAGFVRVYMHSRSRVETEFVDADMVPKQLQLLVLLGD